MTGLSPTTTFPPHPLLIAVNLLELPALRTVLLSPLNCSSDTVADASADTALPQPPLPATSTPRDMLDMLQGAVGSAWQDYLALGIEYHRIPCAFRSHFGCDRNVCIKTTGYDHDAEDITDDMFDFSVNSWSQTRRVETSAGVAELLLDPLDTPSVDQAEQMGTAVGIPAFLTDYFGVQRCFVYLIDEKLRAGDNARASELLTRAKKELETLKAEPHKGEEAIMELKAASKSKEAEWHLAADTPEKVAEDEQTRKFSLRVRMSSVEFFNSAQIKSKGEDMAAQGSVGTWPGYCEPVELDRQREHQQQAGEGEEVMERDEGA